MLILFQLPPIPLLNIQNIIYQYKQIIGIENIIPAPYLSKYFVFIKG